jgi:hypothetical protein
MGRGVYNGVILGGIRQQRRDAALAVQTALASRPLPEIFARK